MKAVERLVHEVCVYLPDIASVTDRVNLINVGIRIEAPAAHLFGKLPIAKGIADWEGVKHLLINAPNLIQLCKHDASVLFYQFTVVRRCP